MHMLWTCVTAMMSLYNLVNPLFCATVLMHRSSNKSKVRKLVHANLKRKISIVFEPPPHQVFNSEILNLLECGLSPDGVNMQNISADQWTKARKLRRDLFAFFPGCWLETEAIIHYCHHGCECRNEAHAKQRGADLFLAAFLILTPKIPALNRWTKLWQPMCWWLFATSFHGAIGNAFLDACRPPDDRVAHAIFEGVDGVGLQEDNTWQLRESLRFKKAEGWLSDPVTRPKLAASCIILQVALEIMGSFFEVAT